MPAMAADPLDVGMTVKVDAAFCLGEPLGEFCPEDAAELLAADACFRSDDDEVVEEDEAESMASFVQSAH